MKKIIIGIIILLSFYCTNGIIRLLKEKDPLMIEIKKTDSKYQIPFQNATIEGNNIIPGIIGKAIDYDKTYQKMKEYGTYNESLTILKEIKPVISIEENYDKYIIEGNPKKKMIAILFLIKEEDQLEPLLQTLKKEQIKGTIFLDGTQLEKNRSLVKTYPEQEYELLSYQNNYQPNFLKTARSYLETTTGKKLKYCLNRPDNKKFLDWCVKEKLHSINPSLTIYNNSLYDLKKNLRNGLIITMNHKLLKKIPILIEYSRKKGYQLVTLETLLRE